MSKILVNAPTGYQEIIELGQGGYYLDLTRVLWDERLDGPVPEGVTLGGMVRMEDPARLEFSQSLYDATYPANPPLPGTAAVSAWQLQAALLDAGRWADALALLPTWPPRMQIEWGARDKHRRDGLVAQALKDGLQISAADVDALFVAAAAIQ
jgi:hypothetical protein